jgi:glutaredoxin 3
MSMLLSHLAINDAGAHFYSSFTPSPTASSSRSITMSNVTIYTTPTCPYCLAAKELLRSKGVAFNEISIQGDRVAAIALAERTGRRTVPQIFISATHVGGFDDLAELHHEGRLDALLDREAEHS